MSELMLIPFRLKKKKSKFCKLSVRKTPNGVEQLIDDQGREVFGVRAITINHGMDIATNATVNVFLTNNEGNHMINRVYSNDLSDVTEIVRKQEGRQISEHIDNE